MENRGEIRIADQVVAVIAGIAASGVDGVTTAASGFYEDIAKKITKKAVAKGVEVTILEDETIIDMRLRVRFGTRIDYVCRQVQERVKEDVETFTGLYVREVNVKVDSIVLEQEEP